MSRDQRTRDNWALIRAQEMALERGVPLVVLFCLASSFLGAGRRQYAFMIKGLQEVALSLERRGIPLVLLTGAPEGVLPPWLKRQGVQALVTDFDPLRIKRAWQEGVCRQVGIPVHEVDAHNIVPCRALSQKQEYGAYTIRPKIHRMLSECLEEYPSLPDRPGAWRRELPEIPWAKLIAQTGDPAVPEVSWVRPGEQAAQAALDRFIAGGLARYGAERNDPTREGQSGLSPYLHFGQLSAQRVALAVMKADAALEAKEAFLEELIVRRELADNYCLYNGAYDRFAGFPEWARKTLDQHRGDRREFLYPREALESAETHDELWNAAQQEMVRQGRMHGYLRMYWAKKILEWTESPEVAQETAIALNDRYELDGRDPNGYAGIAWSIGGVHDRAWNERGVFGKIRYMSYSGCKTKFNIRRYVARIASLPPET
jgi:deoxyribodipyrimidine photo-lyase